jgi:hypothetical protein
MSLRIDRKQDTRTAHACTHNLADIPNGVTVSAADLIAGGILQEGSYIGSDSAGLYHLIKTAKLVEKATATATTYKVAKGHHFKVGDFVTSDAGGKAYAITAIDNTSDATYDEITVGTTLGAALSEGAALVQAAAEAASKAAFKYTPKAVTGDSYNVEALNNHFVAAVTIGQFKAAVSPAASDGLRSALPTVVFI